MRSAKTIVTTFRATALSVVADAPAASEVPQPRQNFAVGVHGIPHDGQRRSRCAPHSSQNAEEGGFSCWQVEQFMGQP
jgi:hypothetical protein